MSITSYSDLKTAVANWLHRSDLTSYVPDLIALGEARIYREMRVRQMETAFSAAIASGVLAVPTGYIEFKTVRVDGSPTSKLERKDIDWIYRNYPTRSSDSEPRFFAREGENFIFGPYPDSTYTIKGVYYKKLTALSDANPTNWLVTEAPDLILFASLAEASAFINADARIQLWEAKYQAVKEALQRQDNQEEFSGSPMSVSAA